MTPPRRIMIALVAALALPAAGADAPTYVGSELCVGCHDAQGAAIAPTPHGTALEDPARPENARGCEACHGPGSAHFEAGGEGGIFAFAARDTAASRVARCRACHAGMPAATTRSEHERAGVACTDCHRMHGGGGAKLLAAPAPRLCYGCHPGVRARFALPEHHPVDEGVVACGDCHGVHGTPEDFDLLDAHDRTCTRCHGEVAGPFVFEHAGRLTEGCAGCHEPHGAIDRHLLKRQSVAQLCYGCHTVTPADHLQPAFRDCTRCHVAIHGSNTDPRFLER